MSFRLQYSDKAVDQLNRLPSGWLDEVARELRQLADTPVSLSKRIASPPFPPRGQLYHFVFVDEVAERWFFTVIFRYSQDENGDSRPECHLARTRSVMELVKEASPVGGSAVYCWERMMSAAGSR